VGLGTVAVGATIVSAPYVAGFGAAGVVKGSIAAGVQSAIGNVAGGSGFAFLQSATAGGLLGTAAPIVLAVVAGTAAVVVAKKAYDMSTEQ